MFTIIIVLSHSYLIFSVKTSRLTKKRFRFLLLKKAKTRFLFLSVSLNVIRMSCVKLIKIKPHRNVWNNPKRARTSNGAKFYESSFRFCSFCFRCCVFFYVPDCVLFFVLLWSVGINAMCRIETGLKNVWIKMLWLFADIQVSS